MLDLRQRVGLVHELAELAAAEELLQRRGHGTDVDHGARRGRRLVLNRHLLLDDPLHANQTDAKLLLDKLPDGADTAVAQVVNVVRPTFAVVQLDQHLHHGDDVFFVQGAYRFAERQSQTLVDLVAANTAKVVAAVTEEGVGHQAAGVIQRGRIAGPDTLIDLDQPVFDALCRVLVDRGCHVLVVRISVDIGEALLQGSAITDADGAQKGADGDLAFAVNLDRHNVSVGGLKLHPGSATGDHLSLAELPAGGGVGL